MPHSMSGLYSLYYSNTYPSEVKAIVGIDASLPQKQLERWTEETFEDVKLSTDTDQLNLSIINQWNKFYDNSKELENIKYPKNLPVLSILATEQIETINKMILSGEIKTSWIEMNKNMITNSTTQFINILDGKHYLHYTQSQKIYELTKSFLKRYINIVK